MKHAKNDRFGSALSDGNENSRRSAPFHIPQPNMKTNPCAIGRVVLLPAVLLTWLCSLPVFAALPLQPEQIVVTCFSGTINYYASSPYVTPNLGNGGYVVAQFDTQTGTIGPLIPTLSQPPYRWSTASTPPFSGFHNETGQPWNAQRLGEVFGICVDDASPPNIYVTATECYNVVSAAPQLPKGPGGPGGVYRLDATTGASTFGSLPNNTVNGPGLGNVCYRRAGNGTGYLYVSDLEDGLIYRMHATGLTNVGTPFNHGVSGRLNASLGSIPDDGTPGLTQYGRRIWGVQTYQNRLYYAVWWEDSRNISLTESNEIWSVNLDNNGDFIPGTEQRLISHPNFSIYAWSHPAASIDFSPSGKMFLAERYWQYLTYNPVPAFGAHNTRILRYWLSGPNWVTDPSTTHHVGGDPSIYFTNNMPGANSAGGVAVNCDESVWGTGDMYAGSYSTPPNIPFGVGDLGYVYGALRIPTGGNSALAGFGYGSFAIDYDNDTNSIAKFGIGAIATVKECCVPPPAGLTAWWPLDELTGATTYADLSGNGNTAIVESGGPLGNFQSPSAILGKVAGASSFLDSLSRGRAPNAASLNFGTNNFTVDCWVRPPLVLPTTWQTIVDKFDAGAARGYTVGISNGTVVLRIGDGVGYTHIGPAINYGVWNFVAVGVNRTANVVRFYVNGVASGPQALVPTGGINNTLDLLIGAPYTPGIVSETALDEIELFNRVLTTNELNSIWVADSLGKCKSGQPPCTNSVVTIICPTNMTIACAPIVYYPAPQASTTCGTITNITCVPPSGSVFPVGPTVVTCTAKDSLGNSNSCTFTITVTPDITPPVINCACLTNNFHEQLNVLGCQGVVPALCGIFSQCFSDNCGIAACSQTPPAGTPVGPGITLITFTITDFAGNSNSCVVPMIVTAPPGGCGDPCTNGWKFLDLAITTTNGIFTGANGTILASTAGGPFMSLNNTAYGSQFPNLFPASGIVTGYLAQAQLGATYSVTFNVSGYALTPGTVFGIWNITEQSNTYKIQVFDCASNPIAPPFPAGIFSFKGWDDDSLSGNIGWYHMTLTPATGLLSTTPFNPTNTDCDAAFWTNLPPNACRIVVTGNSIPDADGVVFYFAEPKPCCKITCPTNITVTTCSSNTVVFYPPPTLSGNCDPGVSVICNPLSGSAFPLGTNVVTCSVVDGTGLPVTSCAFTVTVLPQTPAWSIICPNPAIAINVTGCPPVMPNLSNLITLVTNCPLACPLTVTQSIPPGTPLTGGIHVAIVTVCDCLMNCQVCDVTINAIPTTGNPVITCPPNQVITTCGTNAVAYYKIKATNYTGVITCTPPSGSVFPLGTTYVTCTATNACGGIATCYFSVTVKKPSTRWPCDWQVGIGIPVEPVGGATLAILPVTEAERAIGPVGPTICVFPNPLNPSGVILHPGTAQRVTFTTVLDFNAPEGSRIDLSLPPDPMHPNDPPILSFMRKSGPKGYCVKTAKVFDDAPEALYRSIAVNTNGALLDSFTWTASENATNEPFILAAQPGVSNCHVTVELNMVDGSLSLEFDGPVAYNAARKGWDGCIYGPDRPRKNPPQASRVIVMPPVAPGQPRFTDLFLSAIGYAEVAIAEPTLTARDRKWGDGHVTLMKAYDDGESLRFSSLASGGGVQVDLGHSASFALRLTKFETNTIPGEELLTRTIGPIALTNRPSPPPFLDAVLLKGNGGAVECSADFSNVGATGVTVHLLNNGILVAIGSVPGPIISPDDALVLDRWPERLGHLPGDGVVRLTSTIPFTVSGLSGNEIQIIPELPPGTPRPDYYSGLEFVASEDADWGVTELVRTTVCVAEPVAITQASGEVTVSWAGEIFRLQGAENIAGPWFDLGAASPVTVPASSAARFFRLLCQ